MRVTGRSRTASIATAARMIAPWMARSQYALTPRNVSAGPIVPEQHDAEERAGDVPRPPRDRRAADDDGGDDLAARGRGRRCSESG